MSGDRWTAAEGRAAGAWTAVMIHDTTTGDNDWVGGFISGNDDASRALALEESRRHAVDWNAYRNRTVTWHVPHYWVAHVKRIQADRKSLASAFLALWQRVVP